MRYDIYIYIYIYIYVIRRLKVKRYIFWGQEMGRRKIRDRTIVNILRTENMVSNKSNYNVYVYIVRHNYILGGMLFSVRKAQLHVSAFNTGHLQVVQ